MIIPKDRPSRIDARVRGLSTASSNASSLLASLATEAASLGAELWIPEGTYRGTFNPPSNLTLRGTGTIKAHDGFTGNGTVEILNGTSNVTIEDVAIDGNAITAPLKIGQGIAGNVTNTAVRRVRLSNAAPSGDTNKRLAIRAINTIGLLVDDVTFSNVYTCISLETPNRTTIANCRATTVSNRFLLATMLSTDAANLQVIGNRATGLVGMGIEIFGSGSGLLRDVQIIGNQFEQDAAAPSAAFGMSFVVCPGAQVIGNRVKATGQVSSYGYEVIADEITLIGNRAQGYNTGFVFNGAADFHAANNWAVSCLEGFTVVNVNAGSPRGSLLYNRAFECRDYGIRIYTSDTGVNGEYDVIGNRVRRSIAWTGDSTRTFRGINLGRQDGISRVVRNRVQQANASPTSGFAFHGFVYSGIEVGGLRGTEFHNNIVQDAAAIAVAFDEINTGAGTTADFSGNKLVASDGSVTTVSTWS